MTIIYSQAHSSHCTLITVELRRVRLTKSFIEEQNIEEGNGLLDVVEEETETPKTPPGKFKRLTRFDTSNKLRYAWVDEVRAKQMSSNLQALCKPCNKKISIGHAAWWLG